MTTKKAEKAAAILENRKAAYVKKVNGLLGHVARRLPVATVLAAFDAEITAEKFSVSIAAQEPVGKCIQPMKIDSVNEMEKHTRERIAKLLAKLEEANGDIHVAFPHPGYNAWGDEAKYQREIHNLVRSLTKNTDDLIEIRKFHDKNFRRVADQEAIERKVQTQRDIAAADYDSFICKMVVKVGEVVSAEIEGSHVWGNSILTVAKANATVERWKTQTIVNFSKYGLPFNQWPSRKIK